MNHDFTGNYWGTTDASQIAAWIEDRNDDPSSIFQVIDYLPIAGGPVEGKASSFGELKARYGPR